MSTTEDNTPIDNELKTYLAGEDGVSAAYRQIGADEPPAELDRLILAAAHSAVGSAVSSTVGSEAASAEGSTQGSEVEQLPPRKMASLQQKFAVAASFMVGVLITSMYFKQTNDSAENTGAPAAARERLVIQSLERPAATPASSPAPASASAAPMVVEQQVAPAALATAAPQLLEQIVQQAAPAPAAAPAPQETSEVNKTTSSEDLVLADNPVEAQDIGADAGAAIRQNNIQIATATDAAPPANRATFNETRAESSTADQPLEEIMVMGSRISTEADTSYRGNRQEWLERILAMGEDIIFQIDALEENNSRLEEEMELFTEEYPDVDLEAELQKLETE